MTEVNFSTKNRAILKINLVSLAKKHPPNILETITETFDPVGNVTLTFNRVISSLSESHSANHPWAYNAPQPFAAATPNPRLPQIQELRFLVSAHQLSLSSPVFHAMFCPGFREGEALLSRGEVEVPLPEDCHNAFRIIFNALHGRFHFLPDEVDLYLLASLAATLDKYEFPLLFNHIQDRWFQNCKSPFECGDRALFVWIGTCCGFGMEDTHIRNIIASRWEDFKGSKLQDYDQTPLLRTPWTAPIPPIPEIYLKLLRKTRMRAMKKVYEFIDKMIENYLNERVSVSDLDFCLGESCTHVTNDDNKSCNALVSRRLIKEARDGKIWPVPPPPYANRSFLEISHCIVKMDLRILGCSLGEEKMEVLGRHVENVRQQGINQT